MKANELMLGDWVMYNPNVFIEDEYALYKEPYYTNIGSGENIDLAMEGCFSPIPLTIRMLESNGWLHHPSEDPTEGELRSPEDVCFKEPLVLRYHEGSDAFWWGVGLSEMLRPIRYVHELQHILRSCGIGNNADNFKIY